MPKSKTVPGSYPPVPEHCVVTGAAGFVGRRLVEMLIERGASSVVAFDIAPKAADAFLDPRITFVQGDIRDADAVDQVCAGANCVWHNAAAVGPFHPPQLYDQVNYQGTLNVIEACRKHGVPKIVMSSSPSTRFDGSDVDGLTEDQLPSLPLPSYLQAYASSKAKGEMALAAACCDELMTVAVAPHQVYGPRDNIFLPNLLEAGGTGRLRVFGGGRNKICFTHVDNYCHGLLLGEAALYKGSPALGGFYIVTDGATHPYEEGYHYFYDALEQACTHMGFASIKAKIALPYWILMPIAYLCLLFTRSYLVTGITLKLNPFTVKMLTIHRWFNIQNAQRDLHYEPIVSFKEEWPKTLDWFKQNWLPTFRGTQQGVTGLSQQTANKIAVEAGKNSSKND